MGSFLKTAETYLPQDPFWMPQEVFCFRDACPKEYTNTTLKNIQDPLPIFTAALSIINSSATETAQCPKTNEPELWNEILLSCNKERNAAICNNMEITGGGTAKQSKSVREKQILDDFIPTWNIKKLSQGTDKDKSKQIFGF